MLTIVHVVSGNAGRQNKVGCKESMGHGYIDKRHGMRHSRDELILLRQATTPVVQAQTFGGGRSLFQMGAEILI